MARRISHILRPALTGPGFLRVLRAVVLLTVVLTTSPSWSQSLWEFDPYRIQLLFAFDDDPLLSSTFQTQLLADVEQLIEAYIGAPWSVSSAVLSNTSRWKALDSPHTSTAQDFPASDTPFDKRVLIAVVATPHTWVVRGREFDVLTEQWDADSKITLSQSDNLAYHVFRLVLKNFCPVAEIEEIEDKTAHLSWHASALPPKDRSIQFVRAGDVVRPIVRLLDRDGTTRKVQPIEWTFFSVDQPPVPENAPAAMTLNEPNSTATVYTGVRSQLVRRKRARTQQLALLVHPELRPTEVRLVTRTEQARPLVGYEIYSYTPASPETTLLGYTDRDGSLTVPAAQTPLQLLIVKHGNELLARVPLVPGFEPLLTLRLADDDARLLAEGFLLGLQERLIDVVVRRHVLIARIKLAIGQGRLDQADQLLDQVRRLDGQQQFFLALDQQEQKNVAEDANVQRKVQKMFAETRKLVGQYLDPQEVNRTEIQVDQARRAQASNGSAEAKPNQVTPN